MKLQITGGHVEIDQEDLELISQHKWHITRPKRGIAYARSAYTEGGKIKFRYMHRILMGLDGGRGLFVDHIDGNGLNNQRANLRLASHSENCRNSISSKLGTYKVRGGTYMARIRVNGKQQYIGSFKTQDAAERAYIGASLKHFGEFSVFQRPEWQDDERVKTAKAELLAKLAELRARKAG